MWVVSAADAKEKPILYVHGGGWVVCDLSTHLAVIAGLARASRRPVHAIDHRRAPEHPYPAALLDVCEVIGTMTSYHPSGFAIAGDSAGANLVLAAMLMLKAEEKPHAIEKAILYYGCFFRRMKTDSHIKYGDGSFGLSTEQMELYWNLYAGDKESGGEFTDLSTHGLSGLPPIQLHAAELDCLYDDTILLHKKLMEAGNDVTLHMWMNMTHGFLHFAPRLEMANEAFSASARFLGNN